jgi:hypothetical protein
MYTKHLVAVLLGVVLSGCGGSSTSPSAPSLSGTWSGTTNDNLVGTAQFVAMLSQTGSALSGTYSSSAVQSNSGNGKTGTLTGTVTGSAVALTFTPIPPSAPGGVSCSFTVTATVNGNQLTGTFAFPASAVCVPLTGTITLSKVT